MKSLNIKIIAFSYFDDELQILITKNSKLPTIEFNTNHQITDTVLQYLKENANITIKPDDIQEQPLYNTSGKIYIPIMTQIKNTYARALINDSTNDVYKFQKIKYKNPDITTLDEHLIDLGYHALKNRYKLESLPGIKNLLPDEFTTKNIASLLNNAFHLHIKRNNIGYNFRKYIQYIKKDRSKQGRPTKIYKLKEKHT